ncbi:MAG: electron transport complex subunit RsxC [Firmicutes bacterium]|jgi:electron transport complex protein RnfC|nr:electron transport complex subunit RsxC [Bacillota bacterium]HPU01723.1 electron transport complex subunit RsxC [Bacillota bacterium]
MGAANFRGGVHPEHRKELTASLAITAATIPRKVVIPLQQHIGAPCEPLVKVGDAVKVGQMIGDSEAFVSAPVHASISGTVAAIEPYNHPLGRKVTAIIIEGDGRDEWCSELEPVEKVDDLSPEEIRARIRSAGIVGLGGAAFPAHVKLSPPEGKAIDTVIINGAECEPYLTADHRLMLERPEDIVFGLEVIMKALGAGRGIIGIEDNKPDALRVMRQAIEGKSDMSVVALKTKYPQGAEKMLILATTRRRVPSGGLPLDVGVVNHNVGTTVAIAEAVRKGKPLIERVVTVTGEGVKRPANLMVRLGTLAGDLLEYCGGLREDTCKLIMGGPMMGLAQPTADFPVVKGTSGILALTAEEAAVYENGSCIRCASCVKACPINLVPTFIAQAAEHGLFDRAEKLHAADCIECGCCSYICPAGIPLTQWIRIAKAEVLARRRR